MLTARGARLAVFDDDGPTLPAHLVRFERFPGCGHGVLPDAPDRAMAVIRDFIVH
jgi:proline iminopeptidase